MRVAAAALCLLLALPAGAEPYGDLLLLERIAGTATVQPHVAAVDGGFVVAWNAEGGVTVRRVDEDGRPSGARLRLDLPYALDLLPTADGALAISREHMQQIAGNLALPAVAIEAPLSGLYRGHAWTGDRLVVAVIDRGGDDASLHLQVLDPSGAVLAPQRSWELGEAFVVALPVAPVGEDALVAWTSGDEVLLGRIGGGEEATARVVHKAEPGGALQCCRLAAAPDGRAMLVLADSSRGNFEVVAVPVAADGEPSPAIRLGAHSPADMLRPEAALIDGRFLVAWVGGVEWGLLQRTGQGVAVVAEPEGDTLLHLTAPGSIERVALAAAGGLIALAALVRDEGGLAVAVHVAPWPQRRP